MALFLTGEALIFCGLGVMLWYWYKRKSIDVIEVYLAMVAAIGGALTGIGFAIEHKDSILQFLRVL
jgi:uncharacterized membrane protein YfcA